MSLDDLLKLVPAAEHATFTKGFKAYEELREVVNRKTETAAEQQLRDEDLQRALDRLNEALVELAQVRNR